MTLLAEELEGRVLEKVLGVVGANPESVARVRQEPAALPRIGQYGDRDLPRRRRCFDSHIPLRRLSANLGRFGF